MSKIYEALQRAEQMRSTPLGHLQGSLIASNAVENEPIVDDFSLRDVVTRSWNPKVGTLPVLSETGPLLEQFRSLRSRLYEARLQAPLKTIVISSGSPLEGKTFVSVNLAISLARNSEHNVLLIDGDLRRPSDHRLLGVSTSPGLADYLNGTADLHSIISRGPQQLSNEKASLSSLFNLAFIPGGTALGNSSELIANHRLEELVATVSSSFDWILIDSPPVTVVSDAVDLARVADGVILVSRQGRSSSSTITRTCSAFASSRVLGFVFNDVAKPPKHQYYSYYGTQPTQDDAKPAQRQE